MALAAAQVVSTLAALLAQQSGLGTGGVKTSRSWPWAEADLPACRLYAADEAVDQVAADSTINQHTLDVRAEYTARATADLDDAMHALAAAGLALLFAGSPPPHGLRLTSIERAMATEGEAAVGRITLGLQSTFFVAPSAPQTIL